MIRKAGKTHQEARRGSVGRRRKQSKVSHSSDAPSKLNCAVEEHNSKLLPVQRTLDRISVMTPVCCGDLPDGKVLDDHKQISIKGKNGHKAEPAQDPASTMMMGGFKVVHTFTR